MRQREIRTRRRSLHGTRRRPILIYCGAINTEVDYLERMKDRLGKVTVSIRVVGIGVAPLQVVRAAVVHRDRKPDAYDEVWCVIDVDDFDISAAVVEAHRRGVNLAISNPCFELWLLLHHADCTSYCAGFADVVRRLKRHVPAYDKSRLSFADFERGVADAIRRARSLDSTGREWRSNPSTGVWRLVEQIVGEP